MGCLRIGIAGLLLACGTFLALSLDTGHNELSPTTAEYSAIDPARFEITVAGGQLRVDGHTVSARHERLLLQTAAQSFAAADTTTIFKPLGVAPGHWGRATTSMLDAVVATRSAQAVLDGNTMTIRGVAQGDWHDRVAVLREALPRTLALDLDVIVPDPGIAAIDLCARAIGSYDPGPIIFEESGTVFRTSAYAVLDGIVALADACRDSTIAITGHTDSTGNEVWNQQLSLARAGVVADYLAERGIDRTRLIVAGAGSSLPVADNGTRYGRSLNRRIDVDLRAAGAAATGSAE